MFNFVFKNFEFSKVTALFSLPPVMSASYSHSLSTFGIVSLVSILPILMDSFNVASDLLFRDV